MGVFILRLYLFILAWFIVKLVLQLYLYRQSILLLGSSICMSSRHPPCSVIFVPRVIISTQWFLYHPPSSLKFYHLMQVIITSSKNSQFQVHYNYWEKCNYNYNCNYQFPDNTSVHTKMAWPPSQSEESHHQMLKVHAQDIYRKCVMCRSASRHMASCHRI